MNTALKKVYTYYSKEVPTNNTHKSIMDTISRQNEFSNIEFKYLYIEDNELDVEAYRIREIPTIVMLDENDELVYKLSGNVPLNDVAAILKANI